MDLPRLFSAFAFFAPVDLNFSGQDVADLLDLSLAEVVTINDNHLFYAQVGQHYLSTDSFGLPPNNLTGIQHRDIRACAAGLFIGPCPDLLRIHARIIHQRMRQPVLKCDTKERLRPDIKPHALQVNIWGELLNLLGRGFAQHHWLCEYPSNVLVNGLFISR